MTSLNNQDIVEKRTHEVAAFIDKLSLLKDYNLTSSKIAVADDGSLYSSWSYLSALERKYSGQSRMNTINHIEAEIGNAVDLYNNILNDMESGLDTTTKHSLGQLASSFKEQLVHWQVGINTMKQVYHGDEEVSNKVGIIDQLISNTISRQLFTTNSDPALYDGMY
tara:strand:+ start:2493 stop:2990 length:498 start_codon:yes stop_codon:yes gene_type:complete